MTGIAGSWTIDAVLEKVLTDRERADVAAECLTFDRTGDGLIHSRRIETSRFGTVSIGFDLRTPARRVLTTGVLITPGIRYASRHDRSYAIQDPTDGYRSRIVEFQASLNVEGIEPPASVQQGLPGLSATAIVDHEVLRVPDLLIRSMHINSRDGVPTGFGALLSDVTRPFAIGAAAT